MWLFNEFVGKKWQVVQDDHGWVRHRPDLSWFRWRDLVILRDGFSEVQTISCSLPKKKWKRIRNELLTLPVSVSGSGSFFVSTFEFPYILIYKFHITSTIRSLFLAPPKTPTPQSLSWLEVSKLDAILDITSWDTQNLSWSKIEAISWISDVQPVFLSCVCVCFHVIFVFCCNFENCKWDFCMFFFVMRVQLSNVKLQSLFWTLEFCCLFWGPRRGPGWDGCHMQQHRECPWYQICYRILSY